MQVFFLLLTTAVVIDARCGTGFVQGPSLSDCYKFVSKGAAHWYAAEWRCLSLGGHLASVSDAVASSFLKEEVPSCCSGYYWLGGSNDDQDDSWEWSDRTQFSYTNWDTRPVPLPGIGNMHTYGRLASIAPHEAHRRWRQQYGPVYTYWVGEKSVVSIADYATMQETFVKDGDTYAGRYFFTEGLALLRGSVNGIVLTDGDEWRANRRFALQALREFGMGRPEMQEKILIEVDYILENLKSDLASGVREHDMRKYTDVAIGSVINQMLFGYRYAGGREDEFRRMRFLLDESSRHFSTPLGAAVLMCPSLRHMPPFSGAFRQMRGTFEGLFGFIDRQIHALTADYDPSVYAEMDQIPFVAAYLKHDRAAKAKEEDMSGLLYRDDALRHFCIDLWIAGQGTTSTTLTFGILYLTLDVDAQSRMQAELDRVVAADEHVTLAHKSQLPYTNAVICEVQRVCNLLPDNLNHRVMQDVELNGYYLKAGQVVVPQISCVLSDESVFPEPEKFKPERFLDPNGQLLKVDELIPFSIGKRVCVGESLARMELFLFLANIFHQFKVRPVDPLNPPSSKSLPSFTVEPAPYNVRLEPRHPQAYSLTNGA